MKKAQLWRCVALVMLLFAGIAAQAEAQVPPAINIQGRVVDSTGAPFTGVHNITFTIYDDVLGTTALWNEMHRSLELVDGLFEVMLGNVDPIPGAIWSGEIRGLGIQVEGYPEQAPLLELVSVPYAFRSNRAVKAESVALDVVGTGEIINGSILGEDIAQNGAAHGEVLKWTGAAWEPGQDLTGSSSYWQKFGHILTPADNMDTVWVGMNYLGEVSFEKGLLNVSADSVAVRIHGLGHGMPTGLPYPALQVSADSGLGIYANVGPSRAYYINQSVAISGHCSDPGGMAAALSSEGTQPTLDLTNFGVGSALYAWSWGDSSPSAYFAGGNGIWVNSSAVRNAHFRVNTSGATDDAIVAVDYDGPNLTRDHLGVRSVCKPGDYFGVGGYFEGGWIGARGIVNASGSQLYTGLDGSASSSTGGEGRCIGVRGTAAGARRNEGVLGVANSGDTAIAIYGLAYAAPTSYAGYFAGDVHVTGTITKSGTVSRTDHPLDPENKYLQQSVVESPEMMNVYNGNVVLDDDGEATVVLPEYVEALGIDFRYQLTPVGASMPNLYVAEKISGNQFRIGGGVAGMEVSWMVTGVRHDVYAKANQLQVELDKPDGERGKYLHPELYGKGDAYRAGIRADQGSEAAEKEGKLRETVERIAQEKHERPEPPVVRRER